MMMMNKIFIVTSQCGTVVRGPILFHSLENAKKFVKYEILKCYTLESTFYEFDKTEGKDSILIAKEHGMYEELHNSSSETSSENYIYRFCVSINDDGSEEWYEFKITRVILSEDSEFKDQNPIDYDPAKSEYIDLYILVAGTRTFSDYDLLKETLNELLRSNFLINDVTVHIVAGGARGADTLAAKYAHDWGFELHEFPADWNKYGKAAGPIRNKQMHEFIKSHKHRICVCFWDGKSRGTKHNFELAKQYGTPLKIIRY